MRKNFFAKITIIVLTFSLFTFIQYSYGKEWPTEPITIIYPWSPGGSGHIVTTMVADALQKELGVPVIVEPHAGGAGLIGAALAVRAKPDGNTLFYLSCSAITEKPFARKVPFDPEKAFTYIGQIFDYVYGFCVRSDSPWKTFPEFLEHIKKNPGKVTISTVGTGSTMHVALEKLRWKIPEFKYVHVPYKSSPMVVSAVVGGHVDACLHSPDWVPQVDAGILRLIAAPQYERFPNYPDVPTWRDLGYGVWARSQAALVVPAGVPEEKRERLEKALEKAMDDPGVNRVIKMLRLIKRFTPGKELYDEVIAMYKENKKILPKVFESAK